MAEPARLAGATIHVCEARGQRRAARRSAASAPSARPHEPPAWAELDALRSDRAIFDSRERLPGDRPPAARGAAGHGAERVAAWLLADGEPTDRRGRAHLHGLRRRGAPAQRGAGAVAPGRGVPAPRLGHRGGRARRCKLEGLEVHAAVFRWRMEDREGAGGYELWLRDEPGRGVTRGDRQRLRRGADHAAGQLVRRLVEGVGRSRSRTSARPWPPPPSATASTRCSCSSGARSPRPSSCAAWTPSWARDRSLDGMLDVYFAHLERNVGDDRVHARPARPRPAHGAAHEQRARVGAALAVDAARDRRDLRGGGGLRLRGHAQARGRDLRAHAASGSAAAWSRPTACSWTTSSSTARRRGSWAGGGRSSRTPPRPRREVEAALASRLALARRAGRPGSGASPRGRFRRPGPGGSAGSPTPSTRTPWPARRAAPRARAPGRRRSPTRTGDHLGLLGGAHAR